MPEAPVLVNAEPTGPMPSTADLSVVLDEVRNLIGEVIGEEYLLDLDIDMETSFNDDLEIESIEFVALAEALQLRYGESLDFIGWMSGMDLDAIIDLTVGELVSFVAETIANQEV
jgi:acyl carrier protein